MVGFIFGILVLLVGVGLGVFFGIYKKTSKKFAFVTIVAGVILAVLLTWLGCIVSVPILPAFRPTFRKLRLLIL